MIPLTTKPGTEITPVQNFVHCDHEFRRGAIYHLATWEEGECQCGFKTITVTEVEALVREGSIIIGIASICPQLFDLPVKLPHSLRRFECEEIEDVAPVFEDA